ncbi:MAG: NYN domain-containing protein [Spirochaetia bacterium]|nr:MAG: NYN domain-containing protein [Spirochaetia bacterium]
MENILFIDGRNFISKIEEVLNSKNKIDFSTFNFSGIFDKVLQGVVVNRKIFYFGKIEVYKETEKKSLELIKNQRILKLRLENQGFEVILTGRVRGHIEKCPSGHDMLVFKEKGVDVKMAVDMITFAHRKELKTAIIGSSDSDLQPAVRELGNLGIERIYLGFENSPNKGLAYTADRTILIRNSEINEFIGKNLFNKN